MRKLIYIVSFLTLLTFMLGGCVQRQQPGSEEGGGEFPFLILILVLIFAGVYFLMIRPQRQRQKRQSKLIEELKEGNNVITAGGIYGKVVNIDRESVVIKVEDGNKLRVLKNSIDRKRGS